MKGAEEHDYLSVDRKCSWSQSFIIFVAFLGENLEKKDELSRTLLLSSIIIYIWIFLLLLVHAHTFVVYLHATLKNSSLREPTYLKPKKPHIKEPERKETWLVWARARRDGGDYMVVKLCRWQRSAAAAAPPNVRQDQRSFSWSVCLSLGLWKGSCHYCMKRRSPILYIVLA